MTSTTKGPWLRLLAAVAVLAVALAACSQAKASPTAKASIHLRNFHIDLLGALRPGPTTFDISSAGPTMHELNIARTVFQSDKLPLAADGTVDDTEPHAGFDHLAEAEGIDIGDHASLTVDLTPGHYVLYCNMEGHYMAGMHTDFTVL